MDVDAVKLKTPNIRDRSVFLAKTVTVKCHPKTDQ
jgi:hypothetical protein